VDEQTGSFGFRRAKLRSGITFFSYAPQRYSWPLLVFVILLTYLPFLNNRMIRTAGDDKVYVSQAVEMAQSGQWFLQRLNGQPNYYKGPLHYILLRVGMIFFDRSMWATVYMNLFFVLLGALALGGLVHRHMRELDGWAFWVGGSFAFCAGIYSHTFASQMEVELAGIFALGLYFLDRSGPGKPDYKFWILAGVAGWLKSPLHSVFLGVTAILFWASQGELLPRLKSPKAYLPVLLGVAVCGAAYLPAFLLDNDNFYRIYIQRETLFKPANGAPWHYPIIPFFTYFLFPWTLPAFVAYFDGFSRLIQKFRGVRFNFTRGVSRLFSLGLSLMAPSVLFFLWHPYRGQNYNLPVISGLLLVVTVLWATRSDRMRKWYSFAMMLTVLLLLAVPSGITYITNHFDPMPFWWPTYLLPILWIGFLLSARGLWREGVTFHQMRPGSMVRRSVWMFLALGALLTILGEREMVDVRHRLKTALYANEKVEVSYYNLQKDIWSEWGYLNFQIPHPVKGLFSEDDLFHAIENKDLILVPGDTWLDEMKTIVKKRYPNAEWEETAWRRWRTKGKNADGIPMWKVAWDERDLSLLEKKFYMVRVFPK
jgi:4-amino-4-deoxy-L-arabinose transferase-like glycosyltransferase